MTRTTKNTKAINRISALVLCSVMGITFSSAQAADDKALPDLLKTLRDNGTIDQQTYDRLKHKAVAPAAALSSTAMGGKTKGGLLSFQSADKAFSVKLGGRLEIDAAVYDEDKSDMGSGTEVRRARLYASGTIYNDWEYKNEFDFASGGVSLADVYLRYAGLPVELTVGYFKEPFSLQQMTSEKYVTFMERALPDVFSPSRNIGFGANYHGERYSAALGVFGEGSSSPDSSTDENNESVGVTGRLTFNPLLQTERMVHLGIAVSHRLMGTDHELRYRAPAGDAYQRSAPGGHGHHSRGGEFQPGGTRGRGPCWAPGHCRASICCPT